LRKKDLARGGRDRALRRAGAMSALLKISTKFKKFG